MSQSPLLRLAGKALRALAAPLLTIPLCLLLAMPAPSPVPNRSTTGWADQHQSKGARNSAYLFTAIGHPPTRRTPADTEGVLR